MNKLLLLIVILVLASCKTQSSEDLSNEKQIEFESTIAGERTLSYPDSVLTLVNEVLSRAVLSDSISIGDTLTVVYRVVDSTEVLTFLTERSRNFEIEEVFGLANGELIYAFEQFNYYVREEQTVPWNCEYFVRNGIIMHHVSMGMGETESDEWNPASILEQWDRKNSLYKKERSISSNRSVKNVNVITSRIDSLYQIEGKHHIDTIDWVQLKEQELQVGPEALSFEHLTGYFRYLSFHFLLFDQPKSATVQFDRILEECKNRPKEHSHKIPFWNLFEKSGSAYILYENMIIYHKRRCNYDEIVERPREQRLLDFLYDSVPPANPYFVRVKCGWTRTDIM